MTAVANVTGRPDKVVGMHFFEPTLVMKLIEVVRGAITSNETVEVTIALAKKLGKEPIICKGYSFGHLANRAYFGMLDEAVQMLWERVGSPEDIDKALKMGYNLPMGPFEVGDFAGFWGLLASAEQDRMREAGPIKGHLHPLLRMMAEAGYSGGPGNKGIYDFYRDVLSK
jgi:3-hydroxybutyryl-CoA dehydrogenase